MLETLMVGGEYVAAAKRTCVYAIIFRHIHAKARLKNVIYATNYTNAISERNEN